MNVYACLVHEKRDVIENLVRNLRAFDSNSIILLYNGGFDQNLLDGRWLDGVIIYPSPSPQRYGKLHGFMMDCLAYCVVHIKDFTSVTAVDSDQMLVNSGYSEFILSHIANNSSIGCYTTRHKSPEWVLNGSERGACAASARTVASGWQKLFERLPGGSRAYGHWGFWPGTIFTAEAAWRLTEIVNTDPVIARHLSNSHVFATEELFLPSFVASVELDVAENPCNTSFVTFDDRTAQDISVARTIPSVFWVHRIPRDLHHPARIAVSKIYD